MKTISEFEKSSPDASTPQVHQLTWRQVYLHLRVPVLVLCAASIPLLFSGSNSGGFSALFATPRVAVTLSKELLQKEKVEVVSTRATPPQLSSWRAPSKAAEPQIGAKLNAPPAWGIAKFGPTPPADGWYSGMLRKIRGWFDFGVTTAENTADDISEGVADTVRPVKREVVNAWDAANNVSTQALGETQGWLKSQKPVYYGDLSPSKGKPGSGLEKLLHGTKKSSKKAGRSR